MSIESEKLIAKSMQEIELDKWRFPKELKGVAVNTLDELKERIPREEGFGEIELLTENTPKFSIFIRMQQTPGNKSPTYVAYECPKCDKIVIGPPKIEVENNSESGQEEIKQYCIMCRESIADHIWSYKL